MPELKTMLDIIALDHPGRLEDEESSQERYWAERLIADMDKDDWHALSPSMYDWDYDEESTICGWDPEMVPNRKAARYLATGDVPENLLVTVGVKVYRRPLGQWESGNEVVLISGYWDSAPGHFVENHGDEVWLLNPEPCDVEKHVVQLLDAGRDAMAEQGMVLLNDDKEVQR